MKHCNHYGRGSDPHKSLKDLSPHLLYYVNNIIVMNIKRYRESDYSDRMLYYYLS